MVIQDILGGINFSTGVFGGWQLIGKPIGSSMPQDLASGFEEAMTGFVGAEYKPQFLLAAQLVNGYNYAVICEQTLVTAKPKKHIAIVIINFPAGSIGGKDASIVKIINSVDNDIPEDLKKIFNDAATKLLGTSHKAVAMIGSQIVNGVIYYFISEAVVNRPNAVPTANLAKLWLKPTGEVSLEFIRIPKR